MTAGLDDIDFFFEPVPQQAQRPDVTGSDQIGTTLPLCPHVAAVYVDTGGWTLDADPASPYYGLWVHGDPKCMKPRRLETT